MEHSIIFGPLLYIEGCGFVSNSAAQLISVIDDLVEISLGAYSNPNFFF